eukprot:3025519-Pleurochrysis_carterae.AAC.2
MCEHIHMLLQGLASMLLVLRAWCAQSKQHKLEEHMIEVTSQRQGTKMQLSNLKGSHERKLLGTVSISKK